MKRNFLLETTLLSVVCANVNNALCDSCCIVGREKKFIAKALGIKEGDILFIKMFKVNKKFEDECNTFVDKQGEDFKEKLKNSHIVSLFVGSIDDSGNPKGDCNAFFVLINKEKTINPSSELLEEVGHLDIENFFTKYKGNKVKFMTVKKNCENFSTFYSCKKS